MTTNESDLNTDGLSEDFDREKERASEIGFELGDATTDFRNALRFGQCFDDDVPAAYLPALPDEAKEHLDELINGGELANDAEVIEQYCLGYAEGCAMAVERMRAGRLEQSKKSGAAE